MESGGHPGSAAASAGARAIVASRIASARAAAQARFAGLSEQLEALAEQQALTTHDDEHDPRFDRRRRELVGGPGSQRRHVDPAAVLRHPLRQVTARTRSRAPGSRRIGVGHSLRA